MSSHFDFENELNNLVRLDVPINSGPTPRWRRKALEVPSCNSSSLSLSMNTSPLKISNRSLSQCMNKTPSSGRTPSSARNKTPGKEKTPNKSVNKTPSRGDRYIPNRQSTNFELGHYKLANKIDSDNAETTDACLNEEYKKALKENLQHSKCQSTGDRILAFKERPAAAQGYQNSTKVLYSSTKKSVANKKKSRFIPSNADRILDAPQLLDDFYLNLIDWSSNNVLAVALNENLYLFNTETGDIQLLFTLEGTEDYISSLRWVDDGRHIAVGTSNAEVQLWDVKESKRLRNMMSHAARVGSLCWNDFILSSGSRDGFIHYHDVRVARHHICTLQGHSQEVCGLEWSADMKYLASGGNDNLVNVYDSREVQPLYTFTEHQSAVKALAWCPWQPNILATGGGSADRYIRFWNAYSGALSNSIDTNSQVCAIKWSKTYKELVSSHGYSQNQLTIWSYPSMRRVQDLMGHSARVLSLTLSPDGSTVCSGAADETLRMWKCFAPNCEKKSKKVVSDSSNHMDENRKDSSRIAPLMSIR